MQTNRWTHTYRQTHTHIFGQKDTHTLTDRRILSYRKKHTHRNTLRQTDPSTLTDGHTHRHTLS